MRAWEGVPQAYGIGSQQGHKFGLEEDFICANQFEMSMAMGHQWILYDANIDT